MLGNFNEREMPTEELLFLLLLIEVGSSRLGESDLLPISPKTPATPVDAKKGSNNIGQ